MSRTIAFILTLALALALCACSAAPAGSGTARENGADPEEQSPEPIPTISLEQEAEIESTVHPEDREIRLINAQVEGESSLTVAGEGRYLARAVLPEGMAVDHWLINGEPVDAGGRRFSLEFNSEGVNTVEAVLREELTVRCGMNVYLQFLNEDGNVGWMKYEKVCFENEYVVPTTGETHEGGSITAMVLPIIPPFMQLEYWLIDGERLSEDVLSEGILLLDLDRSITIDAVVREGWWQPPTNKITQLQGEGAGSVPRPADDFPAGPSEERGNSEWTFIDDTRDGVPFDPHVPASDGHEHRWSLQYHYLNWDTGETGNLYICDICGRSFKTVD